MPSLSAGRKFGHDTLDFIRLASPFFALHNVRHLFPALDAFPVLHPLARNMQRVRSKRGDFGFCLQPDDEEMRQIKDVLAGMADDVPKHRWERRCRWFIVPCFGRRRLDSARPRHSGLRYGVMEPLIRSSRRLPKSLWAWMHDLI